MLVSLGPLFRATRDKIRPRAPITVCRSILVEADGHTEW